MVNGSGPRDGKPQHHTAFRDEEPRSSKGQGRAAHHEAAAEHEGDIESDYDERDDDESFDERERGSPSAGRKLSKDDLQDLAKTSSELLRRTLLSGIDIVRDVGKELPKEATQFLAARREQVLQNVSKDVIQHLVNASIDRLFKTVREHKIEMSFRIVKDAPKDASEGPTDPSAHSSKRKNKRV